jgi:hypothetical protein
MRRMFVSAALLSLAATAPLAAERVYVPMIGAPDADGRALATEIWVANGRAKSAVTAGVLRGGVVEKARRFDVQPGGRLLDRVASAGEIGLVAVDAEELAVSAWTAAADGSSVSEVPVIGAYDTYAPSAEPGLEIAQEYDRLLVGAANVSDEPSSCHAILYDESNNELARVPFEVPAKSLARHDAAGWLGAQRAAYAQVGCDRVFFPVAVTTSTNDGGGTRAIFAKDSGPNGTCDRWVTPVPAVTGQAWLINIAGLFHQATQGSSTNHKGIVCVKLPEPELRLGRAVFEWDVTVGPWNSKKKSGVHNLGYFFGERYRSGIVGNINFLGPTKSLAKWMQNFGMPKGSNTNAKAGFAAQERLYHIVYTFDATNKTSTMLVQDSSRTTLQTITGKNAPGNNQTLVLRRYGKGNLDGLGLVLEFGNYGFQHLPEVATFGWLYANLDVKLFAK